MRGPGDDHAERFPRDVERFGRWAPHHERSLLQRSFLTPIQQHGLREVRRVLAPGGCTVLGFSSASSAPARARPKPIRWIGSLST
jgi:hypothetical protein